MLPPNVIITDVRSAARVRRDYQLCVSCLVGIAEQRHFAPWCDASGEEGHCAGGPA